MLYRKEKEILRKFLLGSLTELIIKGGGGGGGRVLTLLTCFPGRNQRVWLVSVSFFQVEEPVKFKKRNATHFSWKLFYLFILLLKI